MEPTAESKLLVNVDVQDGGVLTFTYEFVTYDSDAHFTVQFANYDQFFSILVGPSNQVTVVPLTISHAACWGGLWSSGRVSVSQSLNQWAHQTVTLLVEVSQNGYGDQSQARISSLAIRNCSVTPLTPLSAGAQAFEDDSTKVDIDDMTPAAKTALACFQAAVTNAGGTMKLKSAFRPSDYQLHLREVWKKWNALMPDTSSECAALRAQLQHEFVVTHQMGGSTVRPAGAAGPHTKGIAFDANVAGVDKDTLAAHCGLFRPFPGPCSPTAVCDTVHFQLR